MTRSIATGAFLLCLVCGCPKVTEEDIIPASDGTNLENMQDWETVAATIAMGFTGIDLLVVVDNSGSMAEEQEILATNIYSFVQTLTSPIAAAGASHPGVENIRVALASSDLGLQYGTPPSTEGFPFGDRAVPTCTDGYPTGDDGRFHTAMPATVTLASGVISCAKDMADCPDGWSCSSGSCVSPSGQAESVNCPQIAGQQDWLEVAAGEQNPAMALQAACLSQLGTDGCGVEQQLEASVRALSREDAQRSFLVEDHLLVVLVVTDEEDCSIADQGLFYSPEWQSGTFVDTSNPSSGLLNTACNLPASNEDGYLFDPHRYWEELIALKNNRADAVVFAAVVGVPTGLDMGCQGDGSELDGCLSRQEMKLEVTEFGAEMGVTYRHFAPACERYEGDHLVTSARPGRRFVEVAQQFGENGYVYSICNEDWTAAMRDVARIAAESTEMTCFPERLPWIGLSAEEQAELDCTGCGASTCEIVVESKFDDGEEASCPPGLIADPADIEIEEVKDATGEIVMRIAHCRVPKMPAELDCDAAQQRYLENQELGWYYCENENAGEDHSTCRYDVRLTSATSAAVMGHMINVKCP